MIVLDNSTVVLLTTDYRIMIVSDISTTVMLAID